jgi:hypothetical protein
MGKHSKNSTRKRKPFFYIGSGDNSPSSKNEKKAPSTRSERRKKTAEASEKKDETSSSAASERRKKTAEASEKKDETLSSAASERRKKTAEASRSAKSSKDSFLDVLHDMIYSDSLLDHCFTRKMKKYGITQTCDVLQKYTIKAFVLYKCIKNVDLLPKYITIITNLIEYGIYATHIFPRQEDTRVKDYLSNELSEEKNREVFYILSELDKLRHKILYGRHIPLKPSESDVDENEWKTKIDDYWELSLMQPLTIEFFNTKNKTENMYAVVHSFVIYNRYIISGWAADTFSVPFKYKRVKKHDFVNLLKIMGSVIHSQYEKSEFESFFTKYFFDGPISRVAKPPIETILQGELDKYYTNRHDYDFCILHLKPNPMFPRLMTESDAFEKLVTLLDPVMDMPYSCVSSSSAISSPV